MMRVRVTLTLRTMKTMKTLKILISSTAYVGNLTIKGKAQRWQPLVPGIMGLSPTMVTSTFLSACTIVLGI